MDANRFVRLISLCALAALSSSCSKFGRLSEAEKIAHVQIGAGRSASANSRSQLNGKVAIWGVNAAKNLVASVILNSEADTGTLTLDYGDWVFYAVGWDGTDNFAGAAHCGSTPSTNVNSGTGSIAITINSSSCGADFYGTGQASAVPLRVVSCSNLGGVSNSSSSCSSSPGDFNSVRLGTAGFAQAPPHQGSPGAVVWGPCVALTNSAGYAQSLPVQVPGFFTIQGFSDASCANPLAQFDNRNGLNSSNGETKLYSSPGYNSLFVVHGPPLTPTITSVTAAHPSLRGGFTLQVQGSNFLSGDTVTVGGQSCPVASVTSANITCTAPAATDASLRAVVVHDGVNSTVSPVFSFSYSDDGFGNGSDSASVGNSYTLSSSVSDTSTGTAFGGRSFQSFGNIQQVNGNQVTMRNNFSAAQFNVGDDVIWHVTAAATTDATHPCDTAGTLTPAGSGVANMPGKWGQARITSVSGNVISLDHVLIPSGNARNDLLGVTSRLAGQPFCVIQLVRVPNFQDLTINSSSAPVTVSPPPFSMANGYGGILAWKVAGNLTVSGTYGATFTASGAGFAGGAANSSLAMQGESEIGTGNAVSAANFTGGAPQSNVGGGGGGFCGMGGSGSSASPANGGNAYTNFTDANPINGWGHFGGAGAGGAEGAGGSSGGFVYLGAHNLTGANSGAQLVLNASGSQGSDIGGSYQTGGGGAGGSVLLQVYQGNLGTPVSVYASVAGGKGGTDLGGGGGGGGGFAILHSCTGSEPTWSASAAGGAFGSSGGTNGASGQATSMPESSSTLFCSP